MFSGIILLSVIMFITILSYRRRRLEQRVINNVSLVDWFNLLVMPLFGYSALVLIVSNILSRPFQSILDFDDIQILSFGTLFLVYAFVGNSIHFVGKVLSRYIKGSKHRQIYQINEIFHGKLSHYMVIVCLFVLMFLLAFLEINHPLWIGIETSRIYLIIACGILLGLSGSKAIFYTSGWYGGYHKPLFFLASLLALILVGILRYNNLKLMYYPINIFISSFFFSIIVVFLLKRLLRVSRLDRRGTFRLITRFMSG